MGRMSRLSTSRAAVFVVAACLVRCASAQCTYDTLQAIQEYTATYISGDFATAFSPITADTAANANCAAGSTVANGNTCVLSANGYNTATATCTAGAWNTPTLTATSCTTTITNQATTPTSYVAETTQTATVLCAAGFSCAAAGCQMTCQTDGTFTPAVACVANCPVPQSAGAVVQGIAACVEGGSIPVGQSCNWAQAQGYTCMGTMPLTADCTTAGTDLTVPTCTENACTAYTVADPFKASSTGTNPCSDVTPVVLRAVTNPTCDLECDTDFYVAATGVLECPLAGGTPVTTLVCNDVTCPLSDFPGTAGADAVTPPGTALEACDTVRESDATPCTLTCDTAQGYIPRAGSNPQAKCIRQTGFTAGVWAIATPCLGPAMCDAFACPEGYSRIATAATTACTTIQSASNAGGQPIAVCTADDTNNIATCCREVSCPTNSASTTVGVDLTCDCNAGYTGTLTWQATTSSWVGTCTEIQCPVVALQTGEAASATDGCVDGTTQLTTVSDTTCNIECAAGYTGGTGQISCTQTGALAPPNPALNCQEKACAPFTFPTGVEGDTSATLAACTDGVALSTVAFPSCAVRCAPGFTGTASTITCPLTTQATPAVAPTASPALDCIENRCAAYTFPTGVVGGATDGCTDGISLSTTTDTECQLACGPNYIGATGTLMCAPDAVNGAQPTGGISCTISCLTHTCGTGYTPVANPGTVSCPGGCTDAVCCTEVACPPNSGPIGTCTCNDGFTGTADWDDTADSWRHSCQINCANTAFTGCPANYEAKTPQRDFSCPTGTCQRDDCCDERVCQPAGPRLGYVFGGTPGDQCTTATACSPITCAAGYTGTPTVTCPAQGGTIATSGCTLAGCPANAGGAECLCNSGYIIPNGGQPTFAAGSWTHRCVPVCSNTAVTVCNSAGLMLKETAATIQCPNGATGDCTAALCCDASCDNTGFAGCSAAAGLTLKESPGTLRCGGSAASTCTTALCCDATCASRGTICDPVGFTARANPGGIRCPSSDPNTCTTNGCCTTNECTLYNCPQGYTALTTPPASCGGMCTTNLCCREFTCSPLNVRVGYTIQNAPGCTTATGCQSVTCATGYTGTASLYCPNEGGTFVTEGCTEHQCQQFGTVPPGYTVAGAPSCTSPSTCGAVACATGYVPVQGATPQVYCAAPAGPMQAVNCEQQQCTAFNTAPVPGYSVASGTCTRAVDCGIVSCQPGWNGNAPALSCPTANQAFVGTGCLPNACTAIGTRDGYVIPNTACTTVPDCGTVTCATGWTGTPAVTCPTTGQAFVVTGCTQTACPQNADGPDCRCISGYAGTPQWDAAGLRWTHSCERVDCPDFTTDFPECRCRNGYTSNPVNPTFNRQTGQWTHTCTPVPCPANAMSYVVNNVPCDCCCIAGYSGTIAWNTATSPPGWTGSCTENTCSALQAGSTILDNYNVQTLPCTTTRGCGAVTCKDGYIPSTTDTAGPRVDCQSNGVWATRGCMAASCPTRASRPGLASDPASCACNRGFTGIPTWSGGQWTHSCTAATCPDNAQGEGTCTCRRGYRGTPDWDSVNARWTHSCDLVPCPSDATNHPTCTCNQGGSGAYTWSATTGSWSGTCTTATCPAGGDPNNGCRCGLPGYLDGAAVWDPNTNRWSHTCTVVPCPTGGLFDSGMCRCTKGYSGSPSWVQGTRSWSGTCQMVPCTDPNSSPHPNCDVCNNGFTSNIQWTGSSWQGQCTTTNCIDTASDCVPRITGATTDICAIDGTFRAQCCVSCQNLSPVFTVNENVAPKVGGITTLTTSGTGTKTFEGILINAWPAPTLAHETNQILIPTCIIESGSDIFQPTAAPRMSWDSVTKEIDVSFDLSGASGEANILCLISDNGNPVIQPNFQFTIVANRGLGGCGSGGSCVFPNDKRINVVVGQSYNGPLVSNMQVDPSCTAGRTDLFATQPDVDSTGTVSFVASQNTGETSVICRAPGSSATLFDFVVAVGLVVRLRWLRVLINTDFDSFSKGSFEDSIKAVATSIPISRVIVHWMCQQSSCNTLTDPAACGNTDEEREANGCRSGNSLGAGRHLTLLQNSFGPHYVDFSIESDDVDSSSSVMQARTQNTHAHLQQDTIRCNDGLSSTSCLMERVNAQGVVQGFTPLSTDAPDLIEPVVDVDDDDDDGGSDSIPWWVWLIIGLVALCLLLLLLYFCCCRKKKKGGKNKERKDEVDEREMSKENDEYYTKSNAEEDYTTSAASEEYYGSSYDPNSYGGEVLEFTPDEVIQAQYIDGQYYEGTIWSRAPDGTYNIRWYDGSHSEGVPAEQIMRKA